MPDGARIPVRRRWARKTGPELGPYAPEDLTVRLARENVFVSVRGRALRVSPHLHNTHSDVDRLFELLARYLG